ncbi:Inherit from opiNOG: protein Hydra magnipapillata [Seminavis robusta]|uniref:Inherit from opiNOG: protein Hydra magnipapillata n=1 Tax=Seminavis robusta TaxID=568900 RepID=A0A9N8E3R6_9STRA|nr:Inherit from opiNOG: protein Hydra magnipapillata [Seminavis robusta]|eukprot:Sro588_g171430.1 Inherit from opiNOG: protein Hydra magnipapillata (389) ;mRNA; f:1860-3026
MPSFDELRPVLTDNDKAQEFFIKKGVICPPTVCPRCTRPIAYTPNQRNTVRCRAAACRFIIPSKCDKCDGPMAEYHDDTGELRSKVCQNSSCHWTWRVKGTGYECSVLKGSVLQNVKIRKDQVLWLAYLWLLKVPARTASHITGVSEGTVGRWYRHFRRMVIEMVLQADKEDYMLGGPGRIVEGDEGKFGRRKYNRGRCVNADWVFGMVERGGERKLALIVIPDRKANTLLPLIMSFVRPGTQINTDKHGGYNKIKDLEGYNYEHRTLCHKYEFVAQDGTHTQTIKGNWRVLKKNVPESQREGSNLQEYLYECMWRRKHAKHLWKSFIEGLACLRYRPEDIDRLWEMREDREESWSPEESSVDDSLDANSSVSDDDSLSEPSSDYMVI